MIQKASAQFIAMSAIVVVGAIVFIVFFRSGFQNKYLAVSPTPTITNLPSPTPSIKLNTYKSLRYGYSFSYPDNWQGLFYNEPDKSILYGTHTLANYDFNRVEQFMNHGIVDWKKFVGDQIIIKFDLTAQELKGKSKDDLVKQYFADATIQTVSDLSFGKLETFQYNSVSQMTDQQIRSYIAFFDQKAIYASVYIYNQPNQVILGDSTEWKELKSIFESFSF